MNGKAETMPKYWCVNFDSESKVCLEHGIKKNLWMMQYQYKDDHGNVFQDDNQKAATTTNWKRLGEINAGDKVVAYLRGSKFFAVGTVIEPRRAKTPQDHTDTIQEYVKRKRSHDHKSGYVYYTPVVYEDFTDKWRHPDDKLMRYAQRVDVDQWQHYVPDGVTINGLNKIAVPEIQKAVFKIPKGLYDAVVRKLAQAQGAVTKNQGTEKAKSHSPNDKDDGRFGVDLTTTAEKATDEGYFSPATLQDERKRWLREIVERRGQPEFRNKLLAAYQGRCAVTGCDALAALEAAHIIPYCGPKSDHTSNGLLLRADIHALFDLDLIGIHPKTLTVALAQVLKNTSYSELEGKMLSSPTHSSARPNAKALGERWREFSKSKQ